MENKKNGTPFKVFNFNKTYEVPVNKIDKRNGWITWGQKHDYPNFLLNLYDNYGGALHKSIINKKVKYICATDSQSFGLTKTCKNYLVLREDDISKFLPKKLI